LFKISDNPFQPFNHLVPFKRYVPFKPLSEVSSVPSSQSAPPPHPRGGDWGGGARSV